MRKLTPSERKLLELIGNDGGSVCPGANVPVELARLFRRLVSLGDLTAEETQDGVRYHLTAQGRSDAS